MATTNEFYAKSRFTDEAAEASYLVVLHGFADDETGPYWLVQVNHVTLRNLDEDEAADRFRAAYGEATLWIIGTQAEDGFVSAVNYGDRAATAERTFEAIAEEWALDEIG